MSGQNVEPVCLICVEIFHGINGKFDQLVALDKK